MSTLQHLIEKSNRAPHLTTVFDLARQQVALVGSNGAIHGSLQMASPKDSETNSVSMIVSTQQRQGLGWKLYLAALALSTHNKQALCADRESVRGYSIGMWVKLWNTVELIRKALPIDEQLVECNFDYFEELTETNPDFSEADFDRFADMDYFDLTTAFEKGDITPHIYNHVFSLPAEVAEEIYAPIKHRALTAQEIGDIEALWEDKYD